MGVAAAHNTPIVIPPLAFHDGRPMADSRDVAATFRRNHRDVLRAYREAHCSADFRQRNFAPFKSKDLTGESTSHVLMTKNGFAFLVLGFTGPEAGAFKEAYIERFDAMETELRAQVPDLSDPHALRALLLAHAEREIALEARAEKAENTLAVAAPKAAALDRIAETRGSLNLRESAKTLQVRPSDLNNHMLRHGWLYRAPKSGRLVARQDKINAGLMEHKAVPTADGRTVSQPFITPRGLTRFAQDLHPDLFDAGR
ncbi:phage regulatory protein/antirepressor Ant [Methylobacterium nodulans]|uniref:Phage regulatory protein, Rha family n=1 Tax=Methylobacterium nodulans (strain LMG 21967 / CNCM I-2342 / ORS 2060) TaxID=460265 RepID=B8IT76_METNO|nr:phage regulatory protein/antirepressor Ant [Methylobacterium nodulans]ACL56962.1 phage regulatory protein, Rha family [Methylobacterium nodulans ORS 2060]